MKDKGVTPSLEGIFTDGLLKMIIPTLTPNIKSLLPVKINIKTNLEIILKTTE